MNSLIEALFELECTCCGHTLRQHQYKRFEYQPCSALRKWTDSPPTKCTCSRGTFQDKDILAMIEKYKNATFVLGVDPRLWS